MMQCYVCLDDEGVLLENTCACRSAVVHDDCLRSWIE